MATRTARARAGKQAPANAPARRRSTGKRNKAEAAPASAPAPAAAPLQVEQKNQPLVEDTRLLGRILGDVIRDQTGERTYELVERIRKLSVAWRIRRDANAGGALDALLAQLSTDHMLIVIRAFSYFTHLANIAEDQHRIRRRRFHEQLGSYRPGSLRYSLERLAQAGIDDAAIAATLGRSHISPVLTAHPTEVQRRCILDA